MPDNKLEKRDWNKIVADSKGDLLFLPEGFQTMAKEWFNLREDYNEEVKKMAKKEMTLNIALNNLLFETRKYLEKEGYKDIYLYDIGFEAEALKEGKFILSISRADGNRIPTR